MNSGNRRRSLLICVLLCAVTVAAYWPLWNNEFVSLDDYTYITNNPHVTGGLTWEDVKWSFQVGYAGYWHPVTWLSHMLDVQLFGLDPRGHHLVNLLIHIANTLLLFLVFQRMTKQPWRCALVAALFAVHPLHVESVAWAAERKDVLSTFFMMLTLWAYARYAQKKATRNSQPSTLNYILAVVFFALGLMSKPMLVTLPGVLLLLDFWPLGRVTGGGWRVTRWGFPIPQPSTLNSQPPSSQPSTLNRPTLNPQLSTLFLEKLPFLVLSLAASWVTVVAQGRAHAVSAVATLPLANRFANAAISCLKYLEMTCWPADLAVYYPYPKDSSLFQDERFILAVVLLAAISCFALYRLKQFPWLATGWFWFLGTLLPVIGIVQVGGQAMADRFTYIPLIGVFICLVWAGAGLVAAMHCSWRIPAAMAVAMVLACAAITRGQVRYWRDNFTLASHALEVTGNNYVAEEMLGQALWNRGEHESAIEHFRAALAAEPDFAVTRTDLATALTQSAGVQAAKGSLQEAVATYQSALQVNPSAQAFNGLGQALWQLGRHAEAVEQYNQALQLDPENAEARLNLAVALAGHGNQVAAEKTFAEALRLSHDPLKTRLDYGRALALQGRLAEAGATFRDAVRLYPTNAEANLELGVSLQAAGQTNEAARCFSTARQLEPGLAEKLLRDGRTFEQDGRVDAALRCLTIAAWLKPDAAAVHEKLGMFCLRHNRPDEALTQLKEALRLQPDAPAHCHLGLALSMQGNDAEAIRQYEAAIQLTPDSAEALNDFAWLLATTPDGHLRDGPRAVALAEQACRLTNFKEPTLVGTLAAAYAEAGRFTDAEQTAEKAVALAEAANNPDLASRNRELLELYRAHKTAARGRSN